MSFLLLSLLFTYDGKVTVRLVDQLSSVHSRVGDRVTGVMVSPPTGAQIEGTVTDIKRIKGKQKRAEIRINFDNQRATLLEVDNARETVTGDGRIVGMPLFRAVPSKTADALILAAHAHPVILAVFAATEIARREADKPEIRYATGTELILQWRDSIPAGKVQQPGALARETEVADLIRTLPSRATAHNGTASDFINLVFIGDEDKLKEAFLKAGWSPAEHYSLKAIAKGFFAVADHHSYKEAPVSALYVQGRLPDLVFEKQNDTLAKRHHLRIWRQPVTFLGRPVWIAAATHDTGLKFSRTTKRFTHQIDPHIDLERQKVIDDLIFAEQLSSVGSIPRSDLPPSGRNATGDQIESDGAVAVLVFD
jgi:hypothetical protein